MRYLILPLILLLFCLPALAQTTEPQVQLSTERDATGHFTNWQPLEVTWDATLVADVPDHNATDDDATQEWYVPISETEWQMFTFKRGQKGEYAVRWSKDGELWSDAAACRIIVRGPIHK